MAADFRGVDCAAIDRGLRLRTRAKRAVFMFFMRASHQSSPGL